MNRTRMLFSAAVLSMAAACASTSGTVSASRQPKEDALTTDVVTKTDGVRQCVLMEQARDPAFRSPHARVHVAEDGAVESVAIVGGHIELGDCLERVLKSRSISLAPNGPSDDYDVDISR